MSKDDPLDHLEESKLEDMIGKTVMDVSVEASTVEITFHDGTLCQFILTDENELMFVMGGSG